MPIWPWQNKGRPTIRAGQIRADKVLHIAFRLSQSSEIGVTKPEFKQTENV